MSPNFVLYTREDGSHFIVGRTINWSRRQRGKTFIVVGFPGEYPTRAEAVAAGHVLTAPIEGPCHQQMTFDLSDAG